MREIRFRAWDKENNEWLTPDPFNIFGEFMIIQGLPLERLNDLEINQLTGLKDKNGAEIYEGDIVQADRYYATKRWWSKVEEIPEIEREVSKQKNDTYKVTSVVIYDDGEFQIFSKSLRKFLEWDGRRKILVVNEWKESGRGTGSDYYEGILNVEVIGNIYQDKHLLEQNN